MRPLHGKMILLLWGLLAFFEGGNLRLCLKSVARKGPGRVACDGRRGANGASVRGLFDASEVLESNPGRPCGLSSAQQIDQKRRDQNRDERPGAIEAKDDGQH